MTFAAGQVVTADDLNEALYTGKEVARLSRQTTQSVSDTTDTAVQFDRNTLDFFSGHSTTTNNTRYTPSRPGWYKLSGGVSFTTVAGSTQIQAWFRKNGTDNVEGSHGTDTTDTGTSPMSVACKAVSLPMNGTTDYVELMCRHTSGASIDTATTLARRPMMNVTYGGPL